MRAMLLEQTVDLNDNPAPLSLRDIPIPQPASDEVLLKILACGVCHTELDEVEGRTPPSRYPVVPGHEVVGRVMDLGAEIPLSPTVTTFPLEEANAALLSLKQQSVHGAKVLVMS